jgi:hypothetical protein
MLTRAAQSLLNECGRILGPHKRRWVVIPVFDVVSDMAGKGLDRVKGASPNRPARENAEPRFNHVEPRCTSWSEMKVYCRMGLQPGEHLGCFVCGGVVQDNVQISSLVPPAERLKKPQKIGAGMGCCAFAHDRTGSNVQRGIQADQAIPFVIVCLASRQPGPHGQYRLSPTERLNLSLLVDTENDCIGWRIQIQANNIVDFLFRLRISAELKRFNPVRFESMSLPDAMNRAVRQSHLRRQISRTPMAHAGRGRLQGHRHNLGRFARTHFTRSAAPRLVLQPGQAGFGEPASNTTDLNRCIAGQQRHFSSGNIVCHEQYGPSPPTQASGAR